MPKRMVRLASAFDTRRSLIIPFAFAALFTACAANRAPSTPQAPASRAIRQLNIDLSQIFNAPPMAQGLWGVEIRSLDSGDVLYELNPHKLMMPASNMKLVTL